MELTPELEALPAAEKLRVAAALWSRIAASPESLRLPQEVLDEQQQRLKQMVDHPETAIDRDEMWRRIDASR